MKKKIVYEENPWDDDPILGPTISDDFLPSPQELAKSMQKSRSKITMDVDDKTLKFFKKAASKYHIPYQKMIHAVLDVYVQKFEN